jgi:hypothetical protein
MLRYDQVKFDYEPYPIGLIENVLDPKMYQGLTGDYPELELFKYMPNLGHKYSLSESNNPKDYHRFRKTFNSWHAVNPMTSKTDNALRKTVTINIERKY